jgi:hypothetical protein
MREGGIGFAGGPLSPNLVEHTTVDRQRLLFRKKGNLLTASMFRVD